MVRIEGPVGDDRAFFCSPPGPIGAWTKMAFSSQPLAH